MSKFLKPEVTRERTVHGRVAHDGVEEDSALRQFCQELGKTRRTTTADAEEAVVVTKRVTTVERRAST
jgi:hypothetical protein